MRRQAGIVLTWAALAVGGVLTVASLIEFLRLADRQERYGFPSSAGLLRGIVVGEIVLAILAVLLLRILGRSRMPSFAGAVLLVGLIDVILSAQAGVIP